MAKEPIFKTVKGRITAILVGTIVTAGIVGGVLPAQTAEERFPATQAETINNIKLYF